VQNEKFKKVFEKKCFFEHLVTSGIIFGRF